MAADTEPLLFTGAERIEYQRRIDVDFAIALRGFV